MADAAAQLRSMLSDPGAVWVDHVADGRRAFVAAGATLMVLAAEPGAAVNSRRCRIRFQRPGRA